MKARKKRWLRPALFTLAGALGGLAYYYLASCPDGTCAITSDPFSSMVYMGVIGWLLSGSLGCCCGGSCRT